MIDLKKIMNYLNPFGRKIYNEKNAHDLNLNYNPT